MNQGGKKTASLIQYKEYKKLKWGENKWMKNGRLPLNPETDKWRLYFHESKPLKLRNYVLGRSSISYGPDNSPCVPQMQKLFECLAINDYNDKNCSSLVQDFQKCNDQYETTVRAKKSGQIESSVPVPYASKLTSPQANTLLKKYPQKNK